MAEILIGQIPEAIYFALFMIFVKDLKEKRILFTVLMVAEYFLLKQFIHYNIWFQTLYTFITFLILKVLYKEKAQIIDIFTFTIGSIILIVSCAIFSCLTFFFNVDYTISTLLNRILLFSVVLILNHRLYNIQKIYKKIWDRNDKVKKKIKTTTFRALNVIIFNFSFYIINIGMAYAILYNLVRK